MCVQLGRKSQSRCVRAYNTPPLLLKVYFNVFLRHYYSLHFIALILTLFPLKIASSYCCWPVSNSIFKMQKLNFKTTEAKAIKAEVFLLR